MFESTYAELFLAIIFIVALPLFIKPVFRWLRSIPPSEWTIQRRGRTFYKYKARECRKLIANGNMKSAKEMSDGLKLVAANLDDDGFILEANSIADLLTEYESR